MRYCSKCGNEIEDEAVFCPHCGCRCDYNQPGKRSFNTLLKDHCDCRCDYNQPVVKESTGLQTAAKVFLILSCISGGLLIIPLLWMLPMTISYFNACKEGRAVSTGFKICTLLFINMIAGILMLIDSE